MYLILSIFLVIFILATNIYTTLLLVRSPMYDDLQKFFQKIIIWTIPLLGAYIVYSVMRPSNKIYDPSEAQRKNDEAINRWGHG
jgi:hypothetical protein